MSTPNKHTLYSRDDMTRGDVRALGCGQVGVFSARSPDRDTPNEDAALCVAVDAARAVLAVADGMGGGPAGDEAARLALQALGHSIDGAVTLGRSLRDGILDGFESANKSVPDAGAGAATTLVVTEIEGATCRPFHVGDSGLLLCGQRGRIKHMTTAHSPTGYALEAGVIDEHEALQHAERHVVSNLVGTAEMKIEVGPALRLARRDTLLLASDGLFDNLRVEEIVDAIRTGPMARAVERLAALCQLRMRDGKLDDLTFLLFRSSPPAAGAAGP